MLLDLDLGGWAGERIAHGGRRDALLGRVEMLRLSLNGRSIEARVRGNRPLPYRVSVVIEEQHGPTARCSCSAVLQAPCRHAVAAMETLRFPLRDAPLAGAVRRRAVGRVAAGRGRIVQHAPATPGLVIVGGAERTRTRDERIAAARADELLARRQQARRARVEPAVTDGPPRYAVLPRAATTPHNVTLRGVEVERLSCSCEDFAENELGTCQHVERVKNWRSRQRKRERSSVPREMLSVSWWPRAWIDRIPAPLSEIRIDWPAGEFPRSLSRYFDSEAWLRPRTDDRNGSSWARAACAAARRVAGRRGWAWDLDPAVSARIRAVAREEKIATRRMRASNDPVIWGNVLSRVAFRLHSYQEEGVRFLARTGRAFLADDMGLGKTVQAIVASLLLRESGDVLRTLVVCPASLKHQWQQEIEKVCGERAVVAEGLRSRRLALYRSWTAGFLILNYELILRDLQAIRRAGADLVILDEAQRIKNWSTKTARAVKQLRSPQAFVLTGTPLENRLGELHSLVEFLHLRAAGPRWRLLPFHAVTDSRGRVIAYEGLDVLRGRLQGFFLRRERRAVQSQLPERTDNTFWTGMTPEQWKPYRKHAATAAALLSKRKALPSNEARALLRALTAMRILCNAYAQYAWERHEPLLRHAAPASRAEMRALHSPKLEEFARVLEDLLEEYDDKIVVFSQWLRMLQLAHFAVRARLDRRDLRAETFHGGLSGRQRSEMLDAFRRDPEFRVLFSTDAGGLGLNLQDAASIVVNLEVPWNPAVLEQRVGRVHRIGQSRSVQVLHFVTDGALEERVRQVVEGKQALFDGLLVERASEVVLSEAARSSFVERARTLIADTPG
jgi:superfamily II DNA or RNA helicase